MSGEQQQRASQLPAKSQQQTGMIVPEPIQLLMGQILGSVGSVALHNFPGDAKEQWRMIATAESGQMKHLQDVDGTEIPVKYFYAHKVQIVDDRTGEISEPTRTVLMGDETSGVAFVSDGIARSLGKIIQTFGLGPYDPPILVAVERIRTRRGFQTYNIIPAA